MTARLLQSALAFALCVSLLTAPAYCAAQQEQQGQSGTQSPLPAAPPSQDQQQPAQQPQPAPQPPPVAANATISQSGAPQSGRDLRPSFDHDYSKPPKPLPDITAPYRQVKLPRLDLTNSPRIETLIKDGKLMLSLDDAITLSLENNLNINIARYTPWLSENDLLRAKSGQPFLGTQTIIQPFGLGVIPVISFDPIITTQAADTYTLIPVNNPFISGTGSTSVTALAAHNFQETVGYTQGFHTGTTLQVGWYNDRQSSTSPENIFNPSYQGNMTVTLTQQLLNGFGTTPNTRYIMEAKNEVRAADFYFATQVITTIVSTETAYWELVYARENVKVQEAALATSSKLYNDNKRQLEIGTMAPLDVLTAQSEMATDQQNLILAQTTQLQQQTVLLNAITKQLMDPTLQNVEIIPTTPIESPTNNDVSPLDSAVKEALEKRPEIKQSELLLKNAGIEVKVSRNALLPILSVYGQYEPQGLGGSETINSGATTYVPSTANPIVGANGVPILIGGQPVYLGSAVAFGASTVIPGGFTNAQSQIFQNTFPTYTAGINLTLPIRNRAAQADNARAQLYDRQARVQYQALQNSIAVNVRNAQIALMQDRAQVEAAIVATRLGKDTLAAEQKKYQLGASTSYQVVLRSRDLTTAEGNELRARANLQEALVNYDQAVGRTLEVNNIEVALNGQVPAYHTPSIPGAFSNVHLLNNSGHPSWMGNQ
ncbi:MAG TPA: TolC family protein [Candidatus Acidoferrales bacterium]